MKDTADTYPTPIRLEIDPLDCGWALILPLPNGKTVFCLDPQPAGRAEERQRAIVAVLERYGHTVTIGQQRADYTALSRAALEELGV